MKKRPYIKPVVEVVAVSSQMLASSPPTGGGNGVIGGGGNGSANGDGTDQLSNKRRGTWGNLWE